jgi:hypothetical protein
MARAQVEVEGAPRLRRTLKAAGIALSNLKNVHKGAANIAADGARRRAPRGPKGWLLASIRAGATQRAAFIRAGNNSRVKYGGPINYGWRKRNIKPNPFMNDGAKETEPKWTRLYGDYTTKVLDQVEGK